MRKDFCGRRRHIAAYCCLESQSRCEQVREGARECEKERESARECERQSLLLLTCYSPAILLLLSCVLPATHLSPSRCTPAAIVLPSCYPDATVVRARMLGCSGRCWPVVSFVFEFMWPLLRHFLLFLPSFGLYSFYWKVPSSS